jgi:hypothetical protein
LEGQVQVGGSSGTYISSRGNLLATKNNENWILKGDVNSAFFHASANGRRRKIRICSLETNTDLITSQEEIKVHVVEFYKQLFGGSTQNESLRKWVLESEGVY